MIIGQSLQGRKGLLVSAVPRPGGPLGRYVSVKDIIGLKARGSSVKVHKRSEQMLGSLSKSLNPCGLFERDHVNLV